MAFYGGKRSLTSGFASHCPVDEEVSATIRGHRLTFTDSARRNFPVFFDPFPDGSFQSRYSDMRNLNVIIMGRVTGGTLEADVTNIPCEHHWLLKKNVRGSEP